VSEEYGFEIFPLVDKYSDVLYMPTPDFNFNNPAIDPKYLAVSLLKTMIQHHGVGLAAPQCGLLHRVFVMGAPNGNGYACFNPVILSYQGETAFEEGCLSFKGLYLNIKRPEKIEVKYQDFTGEFHTQTFEGLTSRTFQHELDHLNGIVYISLVNKYILDKAKTKVASNLKKLQRQWAANEKQMVIQKAIQKVAEQKRIEELNKSLNIEIPDIIVNT